ncbi:MAG: O-antigen ligase family protein [Terrisporobacter othiniensis]|uniref:O-antigen ligase family protein n=1 Tax=Terrisporobacter othiniensis TaxID=1577792 RepID=UPI00290DED43|nr:O-antigen ligase family protein [Terrisporobacter othiniensis]MDU6983198.1 O-antigen ligase family protein [Terrisporobacter othiniensis]
MAKYVNSYKTKDNYLELEKKEDIQIGKFVKLYTLLFVMVMFSGSTFMSEYVMQISVIMTAISIFIVIQKGIKKDCYYMGINNRITRIIILFDLFLCFQLLHTFSFKVTFVFVLRFIVYTFMLVFVMKPNVLRYIIKICKAYSFIAAISIIITSLINGERSGGILGSFQYAGILMAVCAGFYIVDYYTEKGLYNVAGLAFTVIALFISGKRSLSIFTFGAYFVISFLYKGKSKLVKFSVMNIILVSMLSLAFCFIPQVRTLIDRFIYYAGDTTYNGRTYYWDVAIDIWNNNKLLGIGMGNYSLYFDKFYHRTGNLEAYDAHNIYIQLLAETGLIGTCLIVLLLIISILRTYKVIKLIRVTKNKKEIQLMYYSLYIQLWFVVYGLSGNPIYGASEFFIYIFGVSILLCVCKKIDCKVNKLKLFNIVWGH